MLSPSVFCADIGSVSAGRFAWSGTDATGAFHGSSSIEDLTRHIGAVLASNAPVALGFECPLFVPLPDDPHRLTASRPNEGNRSWSAGAGAAVLATGLTEVTWILARIREGANSPVKAFLDWGDFAAATGARLFLWEAFVSGRRKGANHIADARRAVDAFVKALPDVVAANHILADKVLSLVGTAMLRAGWSGDIGLLSTPAIVIAASER